MQESSTATRFEAATWLAANVILSQSDIAAWLAWDGKTIDRGPLEDLASRIEIVYDDGAGEIYQIVLDGVDLDQYIRDIEGDECDNVSIGFIRVDGDLVAKIIERLKVSDPVPVTIGRKDRNHLQVEAVESGGVTLAVIAADQHLLGYTWVGPTDTGYTIHRAQKLSLQAGDLNVITLEKLSVARFRKLIAAA